MNLLNGPWRLFGRLMGLILFFASLLVAYGWFYKLAPLRRLADPDWLGMHSEKARWLEEQKDYKRLGTSPDLEFRGDRIGYYGDKRWFLWLEEKTTTDKNFRTCGCTETALALMSNQHSDSWEEWVRTNRTRTQEEWIQAGFSKYGVSVHLPPGNGDTEPLLKLIGAKTWDFLMAGPQGTNAPNAVPSYVQYNAFRWLRDSGFDPVRYAVSNTTAVANDSLVLGLIKYSRWQSTFPIRNELGILAFGKQPEYRLPLPKLLEPRYLATAYALMIVPLLIGITLCLFSRPKKNQNNPVVQYSDSK